MTTDMPDAMPGRSPGRRCATIDGLRPGRTSDSPAPEVDAVDESTGLELVKLLLQVAFADDTVSDAERTALDAAAARLAGAAGTNLVTAALDRKERLLPPNIGLLAQHRTEVLKEVARLGAVDGIQKDELDMVALIGGMLR